MRARKGGLHEHAGVDMRAGGGKAFAPQLPQGGEWGRKRYRQRLAALFRDAPAYEAYDAAQKALKQGNVRKARMLVDKAIRIQPKEAAFHLLKGGIYERTYNEARALKEYKLAANLNPGYYQPHLRLGLSLDSMGRRRQARIALANSVRLLKTAAALHRLGRYAWDEGDLVQAKAYFKQAAESDSNEGKAAYADLLRIDLPDNAGAYLDASLALDGNGQLQFLIQNNTPFPVGNIVVEVSDNSGSRRIRLNGVVRPKDRGVFNMGVRVTQQQIDNSGIRVVSARLAGM